MAWLIAGHCTPISMSGLSGPDTNMYSRHTAGLLLLFAALNDKQNLLSLLDETVILHGYPWNTLLLWVDINAKLGHNSPFLKITFPR